MGRVTSSGQTSLHSTPAANAEPLLTYDTTAREDLRAHALWYLGLVVVFVVMVMALVRGGDGGQETWCTYVLYFPLDSSCAYGKTCVFLGSCMKDVFTDRGRCTYSLGLA